MAVTMLLLGAALLVWPAIPGQAVLPGVGRVVRRAAVPRADPAAGGSPWRAGLGALWYRWRRRWPGRGRPRSARRRSGSGRRVPMLAGIASAAAAVIGVIASWPAGVAAGVAAATAVHLVDRARSATRVRRAVDAVIVALRGLSRGLHAGAAAADAVAEVMRDSPPVVAAVLPRSGWAAGPVQVLLEPELVAARSRLLAGWHLSARHGIPLATVVTTIADDLADRSGAAQARAAQVAGPAVSGYVLAALPVAGLLLGAGMGSDPLAVLTGSTAGGILLVVGTLLCCGGLLWEDRIVRR